AFELSADSPIFDSTDKFLAWKVQGTNLDSRIVRAIHIYQDLLRFHQNDKNRSAFLDADLHRLHFGHNKAVGPNKPARYTAALKRLADQHPKHGVGVRALYQWAELLRDEGDLVQARSLALRGYKALADSHGGKMCFNLLQEIEAKSSRISTERVWNDPHPTINIRYRNLTKVYLRAVAYDYVARMRTLPYRPDYLHENERKVL